MSSFFNFTHVIREHLKAYYLFIYRISAFAVISGSLLFLVGWVWIMAFFMVNTTWIAPTVLTSTSDKMLQFQAGYVNASQQQSTALVAYNQAVRQVQVLTTQLKEIDKVLELSAAALKNETQAGTRILSMAEHVINSRALDTKTNEEMQQYVADAKAHILAARTAMLITEAEAAQAMIQLQSFNNSITDVKSWGVTLEQQMDELRRRRDTLLGNAKSVDAVGAIKTLMDIKQMRLQTESDLKTAQETVDATKRQLDLTALALSSLEQTVYMAARKENLNLAFIQYDNQRIARVGAEVYDCFLTVIFCHKVGTVRRVYNDEQVIEFPLYNIKLSRTVRGFMVDLDVTDPTAMRSSVLFVGKPLFF